MTMIKKVNKIKGLGFVFQDFNWDKGVPEFKAVNLIYGWNGAGKTTLSRLFESVAESPQNKVHYELESDDGNKFGNDQTFPAAVRVFNQSYVDRNLDISTGSANSISILLGSENKEAAQRIHKLEQQLFGIPGDDKKRGEKQKLKEAMELKARTEKTHKKEFSDIARTIGAAIGRGGTATRTYRSPDAEADLTRMSKASPLSDVELARQQKEIGQELRNEISEINNSSLKNVLDVIGKVFQQAEEIVETTTSSQVITRLADHPDLSEWVERGQELHAHHGSDQCEYCGNQISEARITELAGHFNEEDRKLKERIDHCLAELREVYMELKILQHPSKDLFYGELQSEAESNSCSFIEQRNMLLGRVTELAETLKNKRRETTKAQKLQVLNSVPEFSIVISKVDALINKHNTKSQEFRKNQDAAVAAIKNHYLSTIFPDVKAREIELSTLQTQICDLEKSVEEKEAEIEKERAAISSDHKAAEELTKNLHAFLGREELTFEVDENGGDEADTAGYRIMRGDRRASHLSEGEKTAIAFVYFVVHLSDGHFEKDKGIVVIDDPVSSLDSSSMYQAFAFLKGVVGDCSQTFILTHNFEFLRLLLNWRGGPRKKKTGFYMIKNHMIDDMRCATIDEMDKELQIYESEYHYLFKCLKDMKKDLDGTVARAYPIPNIARKLWETFLTYQVPSGEGFYYKIEYLKNEGVDAQKLDAIYKFTNDQSHSTGAGFNPSLVPEAEKVIDYIFELMEALAPNHFKVLSKSIETKKDAA